MIQGFQLDTARRAGAGRAQENVAGLHIPVDDARAVGQGQGLGDGGEQIAAFFCLQFAPSLQQPGQTLAFDQFHGNVGHPIGGGVAHLQGGDDIGVAQRAGCAGLLAEAGTGGLVRAREQHFQRNRTSLHLIVGLVDCAAGRAIRFKERTFVGFSHR